MQRMPRTLPGAFTVPAVALMTVLLTWPTSAAGQEEDGPIPYPDEDAPAETPVDEHGLRELPPTSAETPARNAAPVGDEEEEVQSLSHLDRPDIGLAFSAVGGTLLLDGSTGGGVDPRLAWGARFTWEFGRLFSNAPFTDALFADVGWIHAIQRQGTTRIFNDTHHHAFTLAPAWEIDLGDSHTWGVYGQIGGGVAYLQSTLTADGTGLSIAGLKPLLQYGIGLRGQPSIHPEQKVRLSLRLEVTRFRRSYLDDTLVAASVGGAF